MKCHLLIFLLVFNCLTESLAQQALPIHLGQQTKWEIGTDLLWIINKNVLPRYSLTFRRNIGKGAIRIRGGGDSYGSATTTYNQQESRAYQLRVGYEYRTFLNDNHTYLFYGVEGFYSHDFEFFYDYTLPSTVVGPLAGNSLQYPLWRTTATEKGGAAFFGYKRFLTKNFSVSLESSFQYSIWDMSYWRFGVGGTESQSINYRVFPFTSLNINIHF